MWKRLKRAIRALLGKAVETIEDPKLILEQNLRELNEQVPKMNEHIASVKATVTLLERELDKYQKEYSELISRVKAALSQNREDLAEQYALQIERLKQSIAQTQAELEAARRAYEKALEVKKLFMRERERKIQEARAALQQYERAKWQAQIADAFEQFEVGGIDQTHDEMVRRLQEKSAKYEARLELALESIDTSRLKIDEEMERIQAKESLARLKAELGIDSASAPAPPREEPEGPAKSSLL
ncbi:MAG: PspA/IM30 family protein [Bacteroidia bacterium]|nr:PspA/IM30 family protein [Bacteroidia bacterium]MCX7764390.1 PspA/IM30 family protein [Bacteroidia bacterium]